MILKLSTDEEEVEEGAASAVDHDNHLFRIKMSDIYLKRGFFDEA